MPYIAPEDRDELEPVSEREAMSTGELTFQMTCLADQYLAGNLDFQALGEVIAALECTKLELYRRIAAGYEDAKIEINGDVFVTRVPTARRKVTQSTLESPRPHRDGD